MATSQSDVAVTRVAATIGEVGFQPRTHATRATTSACTINTTATPASPAWVNRGSHKVRSNPVDAEGPSTAAAPIGAANWAATAAMMPPARGRGPPARPPQRRVAAPSAARMAIPTLQNRRSVVPAPSADPKVAMFTITINPLSPSTASPVARSPRRNSATPPRPAARVAPSSTAAWPQGLRRSQPTAAKTAAAIARHSTPSANNSVCVPAPWPPARCGAATGAAGVGWPSSRSTSARRASMAASSPSNGAMTSIRRCRATSWRRFRSESSATSGRARLRPQRPQVALRPVSGAPHRGQTPAKPPPGEDGAPVGVVVGLSMTWSVALICPC